MHKVLSKVSIEKVRQRCSEGDCPVTPAYSVEFLEQMVIDLADDLQLFANRLMQAEVRMAAMVKARDPAETDQIALDYATRIENLFANGWDGVNQRRNAVKCVIREVIGIVLLGAKHEDI